MRISTNSPCWSGTSVGSGNISTNWGQATAREEKNKMYFKINP